MSERQEVGHAQIQCPSCVMIVPVPVFAEITVDEDTGGQQLVTGSDMTALWEHYGSHVIPAGASSFAEADAEAVEKAASWLEEQRDHMWNGNPRRPSNYGRAAGDLRRYAEQLRNGEHP